MVGIACGAASVGFKPIVHSLRPCLPAVLRSGLSVRRLRRNPITVIGSDPGITAAFNGGTHAL